MIVFSADPGTKNFAYTIQKVSFDGDKFKLKFLGTGMLKSPVIDLTGYNAQTQLRHFKKQLKRIKKKYNPDVVAMERFQSRGNGGSTIEAINMMLGMVPIVFGKVNVYFPTAATWKNRTKPYFDLKNAYKHYGLTSKAKSYTGKTEHQLDASLIGLWVFHKETEGLGDFAIFERLTLDKYVELLQDATDLSY